ncbi:hypothetical protein C8T65DRAFT_693053 [Cerioporus squamosus]|nr:hypothetical protein C8T65DRAFT_693051 [Cerioporus squamosus]KAI0719724.1 hypothetical protein C8T65DRAFT_693053 [Cerioporus squamosus]
MVPCQWSDQLTLLCLAGSPPLGCASSGAKSTEDSKSPSHISDRPTRNPQLQSDYEWIAGQGLLRHSQIVEDEVDERITHGSLGTVQDSRLAAHDATTPSDVPGETSEAVQTRGQCRLEGQVRNFEDRAFEVEACVTYSHCVSNAYCPSLVSSSTAASELEGTERCTRIVQAGVGHGPDAYEDSRSARHEPSQLGHLDNVEDVLVRTQCVLRIAAKTVATRYLSKPASVAIHPRTENNRPALDEHLGIRLSTHGICQTIEISTGGARPAHAQWQLAVNIRARKTQQSRVTLRHLGEQRRSESGRYGDLESNVFDSHAGNARPTAVRPDAKELGTTCCGFKILAHQSRICRSTREYPPVAQEPQNALDWGVVETAWSSVPGWPPDTKTIATMLSARAVDGRPARFSLGPWNSLESRPAGDSAPSPTALQGTDLVSDDDDLDKSRERPAADTVDIGLLKQHDCEYTVRPSSDK